VLRSLGEDPLAGHSVPPRYRAYIMKNLVNPVKAFAGYLGSVFILLLYSKLSFRGVETA
jgi:hypothetical protein